MLQHAASSMPILLVIVAILVALPLAYLFGRKSGRPGG